MADREMPPRWEEIAEMREQEQRVLGSGREVVSWRDQIVVKVGLFLFLLVGGIALLSIFSWPMVITLMRLSNTNNTLKHSQFYISAFLLPFVTDGSEVAELLRQAKHKNRKAVSLLYVDSVCPLQCTADVRGRSCCPTRAHFSSPVDIAPYSSA